MPEPRARAAIHAHYDELGLPPDADPKRAAVEPVRLVMELQDRLEFVTVVDVDGEEHCVTVSDFAGSGPV